MKYAKNDKIKKPEKAPSKKPDGRGKNPNSKKNLIPFSKDFQPDHPGAKKGSKHITTLIRKFMDSTEIVTNPTTKMQEALSQIEIMVLAMIAKARKGDVRAFKELVDRVYGQAEENINFNLGEESAKRSKIESDMTQEEASRIYKDVIKKSKEGA